MKVCHIIDSSGSDMSTGGSLLRSLIKTEVDSDVEAVSSGEDSVDESTIGMHNVSTTNYHDTRLPMLEDFVGQYNFTYHLPKAGVSSIKPTWEYSEIFNQVFIKMDCVLVVQFSFNSAQLDMDDVYIRAVLVYSSADHVFVPVNRCAVHSVEEDPMAKSHADKDRCLCPLYNLAGHVLRCRSPQAIYCYDPKSERHSVLCPAKNSADLLYSFRCKNSCPNGMHRRGTKLVFTLENGTGKMLGRSSLDVKICSCPRRDKDKMEKTFRNGNHTAAAVQSVNNTMWSTNGSQSPTSDSPPVMIKSSSVSVQLEEGNGYGDDEDPEQPVNLPGEVIMQIRSEIRNIRQVLNVAERRFTRIRDLLNEPNN